jgi:hypothetical protein
MTIGISQPVGQFDNDKLKFEPFWIEGVGVSQAIQYSWAARHRSDKNDRGPDNSIALVSEKAAWFGSTFIRYSICRL